VCCILTVKLSESPSVLLLATGEGEDDKVGYSATRG